MKKLLKIVTIISIIAVSATFFYGCKQEVLATSENPFALASMEVRPSGEKMDAFNIDLEGEAAIAKAVELYELACYNDKQLDYRACYSVCPLDAKAMGLNNEVLLNILEIKNGTEYYRIDYRLKKNITLFTVAPYAEEQINNSIELVTTERRYMSTSMDYTWYQKVRNAKTDENGVPYADWSKAEDITELKDPEQGPSKPKIFNKNQEGDYTKTDHVINEDTVKTATITYDESKGIYTVTIELDCTIDDNGYNAATEFTRPLIQEGAGTDNAKYNKIVIEFELWDNGYFKKYKSTEDWDAKALNLFPVTSSFYYTDLYSYDAEDCNISKYFKDGAFVNDYNAN